MQRKALTTMFSLIHNNQKNVWKEWLRLAYIFLKTLLHKPLVPNESANAWPKSLWDFKSEISSLYFNDFIFIKIISLEGH